MRRFLGWFARAGWDALSSLLRLKLSFVSADSEQRIAGQQLRQDFAAIPMAEAEQEGAAVRGSWASNRLRLRQEVARRDARGFLTWAVIRDTMFPPPYASFAWAELKYLKGHGWELWQRIIRERPTGLPMPCLFQPRSSTNAIHHAYHLCRFQNETGARIGGAGTIVEFGGGYGSLCRIAHALGVRAQYVIFDLPEQSALQRYYLRLAGVPDVQTISEMAMLRAAAGSAPGPRMFVATWSLSESPMQLRRQVAEAVGRFDLFLIAYQDEFGGVDNRAFFREWERWFPHVRWNTFSMEHLPASSYLFGVRKE